MHQAVKTKQVCQAWDMRPDDCRLLEPQRIEVEVIIEPGHVMSRKKYEEMVGQQQK
jgi:hypothetical protein